MSKISVDLHSSNSGLGEGIKKVDPSSEQLAQVFKSCLLAIEQLGEIASMLEVIKVSFFQPCLAYHLNFFLKVILVEPKYSRIKFEVRAEQPYGWSLSENPDSAIIAISLVEEVRKAVNERIKNNQENCKVMHKMIESSEALTQT